MGARATRALESTRTKHHRGWIVLLCVLGALPVRAGWTALSVPGTPRDVQIVGPGRFSVATTEGAFSFQGTALQASMRTGESIQGSFLATNGCMCAVDGSNGRLTDTCTAPNQQLFGSGVLRMRHAGTGGGGYLTRSLGGAGALHFFPTGASTNLTPAETNVAIAGHLPMGPLDVVQTPVGTMALLQIQFGGTSNTTLLVARENAMLGTTTASGTGFARDVALVSTPTGLHGFIGADGGLFRIDSTDAGATWSAAQKLYSPLAGESVRSVSLDGRGGLSGANGHGAMVVAGGDSDRLFRSLPTFSPQGPPGAQWIETLTGLSSGVPYAGVTCLGGHTCVAYRNVSGSNNLALYVNDAAPVVTPGPVPAPVGEGMPVVLNLAGVSDADGDPVALNWSVETAVGAPPIHSVGNQGRQLTMDTTGLQICEPSRAVTVKTIASDGLSVHQNTTTQTLQILRSRSPKISPASGVLMPGAAALPIEARPDDFSICSPSAWRWSVSGPGSLIPMNGQQTMLSATGPACTPEGGVVTVSVEATAPGGNVSSPAAIFEVPAWGPSPAPFPVTVFQQTAGTTERYASATHACASAPGFPGQQSAWRLLQAAPPDVRLLDDGGQTIEAEGVSAGLTVEAGACAAGVIELEVESALVGGTWLPSRSTLSIEVVQPVFTVADATLAVQLDEVSGGLVQGRLSTNIPCPGAEGWMASVELKQGVRSLGPPIQLNPDAAFELPVPELCTGGVFTLEATLLSPTGEPGMQVSVPFTVEPAPAQVGTLVETPVLAGCAHGARAALTLVPPAGACLGATWTWTRIDGPSLEQDVLSGRTVTFQSAAGLELAALIGHTVRFEVRAEAGSGNVDVREIAVPIGAEVLVDVSAATEQALVAADAYTGARLEVQNATSCSLRTLQLHAPLTGYVVAPGPVTLDGRPATAVLGGGGLVIDDLSLAASGTTTLELMMRPSLTGRAPSLEAEVLLNGVRISAPLRGSPAPTSTGCGCSGGTGITGWNLALGLLALLRRRSRRCGGGNA